MLNSVVRMKVVVVYNAHIMLLYIIKHLALHLWLLHFITENTGGVVVQLAWIIQVGTCHPMDDHTAS